MPDPGQMADLAIRVFCQVCLVNPSKTTIQTLIFAELLREHSLSRFLRTVASLMPSSNTSLMDSGLCTNFAWMMDMCSTGAVTRLRGSLTRRRRTAMSRRTSLDRIQMHLLTHAMLYMVNWYGQCSLFFCFPLKFHSLLLLQELATQARNSTDPNKQSVFIPEGHHPPDAANINVVPRRGFALPPSENPNDRGSPSDNPAKGEVRDKLRTEDSKQSANSQADHHQYRLQHATNLRCKDPGTETTPYLR